MSTSSASHAASENPSPVLSRRALAWAWDAVHRYGLQIPGAPQWTLLPLTQSELARHENCSAGTIAWYLRCLGPAVQRRRGGIVLDRGKLAALAPNELEGPTERAIAVHQALTAAFGRAGLNGVELVDGDRPASLAAMGRHLGINPSSTHRHLTALQRAGHVQRQGRRLYVVAPDDPSTATTDGTLTPPRRDAAMTAGDRMEGACHHDRTLALLERITELLGTVAELARSGLETPCSRATYVEDDPRIRCAPFADSTELRASSVADRGPGSSQEPDLIDQADLQITSNQPSDSAERSRNAPGLREADSRMDGAWSTKELPGLLAPLLDECQRAGLPGVADANRVAIALRPYDAQQIKGAVATMVAQLRAGAPMHSPIGLLIRKAEDGDRYYFRARQETPPAPLAPLIDLPVEDEDAEADDAIAAMSGAELSALDALVRQALQARLGGRTRAIDGTMADPEGLAHERRRAWRAHLAPTPDRKDTS